MALTKEVKDRIVKEYALKEGDTGSTEVQVAILTEEINNLNAHLSVHIHDFTSKRGLRMKVGQRRALLAYLKENNPERYSTLIKKLGLRH